MTSGKGKMPSLVLVNSNGSGPGGEEDGIYTAAYKRLPEQSPGTVRFFDRSGDGDYFVAYNADAKLVAKEAYKTEGVIKSCKYQDQGVGKTLEYVTLNRTTFESFVRELLLVRQYRVEVFVNESKTKSRIEWVPKYKASPGNLSQFEDVLFENNEMTVNNGVIGIRFGNVDKTKTVGVAFVNMNEFEICLVEFADNDALTNLESVLVQLAPKEAVFPSASSQTDETIMLQKILERNRILTNPMKISEFNDKDIGQDMGRLLHFDKGKLRNIATIPDFEKKLAVSALAGAIRYLELLSGDSHQNQFHMRPFDMGLYVKLDAAACKALHLSLNALEKKSRHDVTLLGTVDKCRTAQGHRLMAQILRQPLLSKEKLEERLDLVQILVEDVVLRQSLYDDYLRRVPDCQAISRKLIRKKATLQDYYKSYVFIQKMNKMLQDLKANQSELKHVLESRFIEPLSALQDDLNKFQSLVEETLDLDEAGRGDFVVRPGFDEGLQGLMSEMKEIEQDMNALTEDVADELNLPARSVTLEYLNTLGHFFRMTTKDEKNLRNNRKFEIIRTVKGAVNFRNTKLEGLSNNYSAVRSNYEQEQRKIVAEIAEIAADYQACFEQLGRLLAELDVFTSFAYVSANSSMPYIRPILLPRGTGRIWFEELRHPCIENLPDITFIPNDVEFDKEKQKFIILTGPNMGGKSTYLRSIGVATLLAHVGCFVPAAQAEISLVDSVLARIGASDNLVKGVSTFMAEMVEAAHIVKSATSDSLVLIDELGRGTSTYDGFGICWAISKHLALNVGCYCVLATHFHELTALADEVPAAQNFHVTAVAGDEGLTMLYKIEKGPCDRSFGLHVAKSVGFPEKVLNVAKDMCEMLEDFCQEKDTDDSPTAVKRRREEKMAGQQVIKEILEDVKELCRNGNQIDNEEAKTELNAKLQTILERAQERAVDNPYLQHLLEQAKRSKNFQLQQNNILPPPLAGTDKS